MLQVELYLAVGLARQVVGHLLVVNGAMAPEHEVALHLVGRLAGQLVALGAGGHDLQALPKLLHQPSIVAQANVGRGARHGGRLGMDALGLADVERPVDVELFAAHQVEMVPEGLLIVGVIAKLGYLGFHELHDALGAAQPGVTVGQAHCIVYHLLYFTPIFGHEQRLALGVVV